MRKFNACDVKTTEGGVALTAFHGKKEKLDIPDEIDGQPVVSIAPGAFENAALGEVILPMHLRSIGDGAFKGSNVKSVTFPPYLVSIGKEAFANCSRLKTASLPESLQEIGDHAFASCPALTSVTLHDKLQHLGNDLFEDDSELVLKLPDDIELPKAWGENWNSSHAPIIYGYVTLRHVDKVYSHHVQAVYDFNLVVRKHDFIVLVGPSGCGKSTTLRMIAGLEDISAGELYIDGNYSNETQPKDRGIAMVFQSYALYPHMTVRENMSFGLKMRHFSSQEIDRRVEDAAKILELTPYLDRKPKELSGGQRQRVALGRAIVRNAKVFLMDEPLSNLDAKLRVQMRADLITLHEKIGATTIYVTHDQTEAMTMATRIVIMCAGRVQQIGEPRLVYNHPANRFVAGFIGSPGMNFLRAVYQNGSVTLDNGFSFAVNDDQKQGLSAYDGKEIILGVRPEHIAEDPDGLPVEVEVAELLGSETLCHFHLGTTSVIAKLSSKNEIQSHDTIKIHFVRHHLSFFDPTNDVSILDEQYCLDRSLPSKIKGVHVVANGLILTSEDGNTHKINAGMDDLDLQVVEGVKEVSFDHLNLEEGKEFVQETADYRVYFSEKMVHKILKTTAKAGGNSFGLSVRWSKTQK
jgi:multiple sugar transport system ATP-binding protein